MSTALPPVVAAFFQAHNTAQTDGFQQLFTDDAVVHDEEREHRGPAIKAWIDGAIAKYRPVAEVAALVEGAGKNIVTARVSGRFPGSPVELRYQFTLRDGRISALTIGP